jgi:hypothetical protein
MFGKLIVIRLKVYVFKPVPQSGYRLCCAKPVPQSGYRITEKYAVQML